MNTTSQTLRHGYDIISVFPVNSRPKHPSIRARVRQLNKVISSLLLYIYIYLTSWRLCCKERAKNATASDMR